MMNMPLMQVIVLLILTIYFFSKAKCNTNLYSFLIKRKEAIIIQMIVYTTNQVL